MGQFSLGVFSKFAATEPKRLGLAGLNAQHDLFTHVHRASMFLQGPLSPAQSSGPLPWRLVVPRGQKGHLQSPQQLGPGLAENHCPHVHPSKQWQTSPNLFTWRQVIDSGQIWDKVPHALQRRACNRAIQNPPQPAPYVGTVTVSSLPRESG